jgi:hypothetical protein
VTRLANRLEHLLAAHAGSRTGCTGERDFADRLDACKHHRLGLAGVVTPDAGHQLREEQKKRDRHQEGKHEHDRQLLGCFYR